MRIRLVAALGVCWLGMTGVANASPVNIWSTGFAGGYFETIGPFPRTSLGVTFGGGSIQGAESLPGFGTHYYRNDTGGTTVFSASGLGAHTELLLSFDLVFLDSWDGLDGAPAPDILFLTITGGPSLQLTTNTASGSAANYGPGVLVAPVLNYAQNASWGDAVVHYSFVLPHSVAGFSFSLTFGGAGFQGGLDESWGLDNLSLAADTSTQSEVPEPMTLSLLAIGLSGLAIRRRLAKS